MKRYKLKVPITPKRENTTPWFVLRSLSGQVIDKSLKIEVRMMTVSNIDIKPQSFPNLTFIEFCDIPEEWLEEIKDEPVTLHNIAVGEKVYSAGMETDLLKIIDDILWMAVRYAHGRHTYAPHMVRDAVFKMKELYPGYKIKDDQTLSKCPEDACIPGDYLNDLFEEE